MGNPNKDSNRATRDLTSPQDACQAACNLSLEREARYATLAKQVAGAIAREMAKAHTHTTRPYSMTEVQLKMTSRALGFKVMDPFYWTKDKAIYQRWQMWSERLDTSLMPWKVIQKRLKFHTSTTGLTVKEWPRLSHGRIKRARRTIRISRKMKKKLC